MLRAVTQATALLIVAVSLVSCGNSDENYRSGYNDGSAVGYNSACNIRRTWIHGDVNNNDYAHGYADGVVDGIASCLRGKGQTANERGICFSRLQRRPPEARSGGSILDADGGSIFNAD